MESSEGIAFERTAHTKKLTTRHPLCKTWEQCHLDDLKMIPNTKHLLQTLLPNIFSTAVRHRNLTRKMMNKSRVYS